MGQKKGRHSFYSLVSARMENRLKLERQKKKKKTKKKKKKKRDGGLKRHHDLIHNIAPISIILSTRRRRWMLLENISPHRTLFSVRWTVPIAFHGPTDRHSAPFSKHSTLIFYDQYTTSTFYMVYCKSTLLFDSSICYKTVSTGIKLQK